MEETDENNALIYEKVRWNTSKMLKHLVFVSQRKTEQVKPNIEFIQIFSERLKMMSSIFTNEPQTITIFE